MTRNSSTRLVVVISSTVRDLPEHREEVKDACLRMDMLPKMMEQLPASDSDAIEESLRLVDEADIYLGIFAHRYGHVPVGQDMSIVEMEYERAFVRRIPRLIFVMHEDHPVRASDVETGEGAVKLNALKKRLEAEQVVNYFDSPDDLHANVIAALSHHRERGMPSSPIISDIPEPPEPYIAHRYTLLQTPDLVGRLEELSLLTSLVARPDLKVYKVRILNVVGISGAGKSALAWKWFNDIAPQEMNPLAGRMWWSFYESDATFENFVTRALAYISRRVIDDVQKIPATEREAQLLAALDREPFLIVLDGLERLLNAYTRADAPRLYDGLGEETANQMSSALGFPGSAAPPLAGDLRRRKTTDPRVGNFLRKLSSVRASRILITTLTAPADLQTATGDALPGTFVYSIGGLSDHDALHLWAEFKVTGSRDKLLDFFHTFGNLPLLIQTLTGLVAQYRRAPGNFDDWRRDNPTLTAFDLTLGEKIRAVLSTALHDLEEPVKKVLHTIAAFYMHMPVPYTTLVDLLVAKKEGGRKRELFADEGALIAALAELEERNLLGWDRRENRYDLHPIIRGMVWNDLTDEVRQEIYWKLLEYFRALSSEKRWSDVERLEDLTAEIEHYNALIKLGQYEKAGRAFLAFLDKQLAYGLGDHRRRAELLRLFFPEGLDELPRHKRQGGQAFILSDLATAYLLCGQPRLAVRLYQMELKLLQEMEKRIPDSKPLGILIGLRKMGIALGQTGELYKAEHSFRTALLETPEVDERFHEAICWQWLGILLATRGEMTEARANLKRAKKILSDLERSQSLGFVYSFLAQCELWLGEPDAAQQHIDRAWHLAQIKQYERDLTRVKRLQGAAALEQSVRLAAVRKLDAAEGKLKSAEDNFNYALLMARAVTHVREELESLIGLAELERRRLSFDAARALLGDVVELAANSHYILSHADACNVLAEVERDAGNMTAAVEAATQAYRMAWCDGPPFAYHWGLEKARGLLRELGAAEPLMPPFDESKYEPMPEVEIDPPEDHQRII
jgi:tetratricopeptide (TPR) repeat protein